MGRTKEKLASIKLEREPIFSNRMVIELAESIHVHYRNLRLILSLQDFKELSKGFVQAMTRWGRRGYPEPKDGQHIELCRKSIANNPHNEGIKINWNVNLYRINNDKIYSEGADFKDETYIHLKYRDIRLEMSIEEFKELAKVVGEAKEKLDVVTKTH